SRESLPIRPVRRPLRKTSGRNARKTNALLASRDEKRFPAVPPCLAVTGPLVTGTDRPRRPYTRSLDNGGRTRLRLRTDPAAGSARWRPPAPHRLAGRLRGDFSGHLRRELHPAPGPGALPVHGAPSLEGGGGLLSSFVGVRFLNLLARMLSRPGPAGTPFPAPYRAGRP